MCKDDARVGTASYQSVYRPARRKRSKEESAAAIPACLKMAGDARQHRQPLVLDMSVPGGLMSLEIRAQNIEISDALRTYIDRRLSFALRKFTDRLSRVTVRLADLNGPRGGIDKRCQISADVRISQAVSLQAVDADLYAAIDRAAGRLERSLARSLGRGRESRRGRKSIRKVDGLRPQLPVS